MACEYLCFRKVDFPVCRCLDFKGYRLEGADGAAGGGVAGIETGVLGAEAAADGSSRIGAASDKAAAVSLDLSAAAEGPSWLEGASRIAGSAGIGAGSAGSGGKKERNDEITTSLLDPASNSTLAVTSPLSIFPLIVCRYGANIWIRLPSDKDFNL